MKNTPRHGAASALLACLIGLLAWSCSSLDTATQAAGVARPGRAKTGTSLAAARAAVDVSRYRSSTPDPRATSVPEELSALAFAKPAKGLARLVDWLVEGQSDPYVKAKILHDWEAINISYDVKAYYSNAIPDQSYFSVMMRKSAVCAGYSALYKQLCDLGGVTCAVVSGSARGANFSSGKGLMGHDWNGLLIDGVWRLVDVTWDSCYVNSPTDYGHDYGCAYFLLDPEYMIYTHFPGSPSQQLLDRPITLAQFADLPFADARFLLNTRRPLDGLHILNESSGFSTIEIPRESGARLGASLVKSSSASWDGDGGEHALSIPVVEGEGKSSLVLAFPSAGDYILSIYAWRGQDMKGGGNCQFRFKATAGTKRSPLGFDSAFQELVGLPREGDTVETHVKKELSLTFPCGPDLHFQAHLATKSGNVLSYIDGGAVVSRVAGGYRVNAAFPAKGNFTLSLSAETPDGRKAWASLPLIADEAADHGFLDFSREFLNITGAPLGGLLVSDRAGAEFSLSFPSAAGVELDAALGSKRSPADTGITYDSSSRRRCLVTQGPGGALGLKVAFPGPGTYSLWLEATGPKGEKASSYLTVKASAGLGHGYAKFDKRLVAAAGIPSLRSPAGAPDGASVGAPIGELASDIVGKRIDLLFPRLDPDLSLSAGLFTATVNGNTTKFDSIKGASMTKTEAGWLLSVQFPKPDEYVIFVWGSKKGETKSQTFDGIYLSSRWPRD